MNWDDLKYFLALADHRSLSAAARNLSVSHATVARRVTAFEQGLPGPVFEKTASGYELTRLGEELVDVARSTETQIQRMERLVSAWESTPSGRVRLAIPGFFAPAFSARLAHALLAKHPQIMPELVDSQSFANLRKQEADLAIRLYLAGVDDDPSVRIRKVGSIEWSFYATAELASQHRLSYPMEPAAGAPFVTHCATAPARPGYEWLVAHWDEPNIVIECSSLTANLACVKAGLGAGCVPDFAAREAGLVRLTDPVFAMMGAVVMHPDMERSPRVRAVADFLVDYLRSQPAPFT